MDNPPQADRVRFEEPTCDAQAQAMFAYEETIRRDELFRERCRIVQLLSKPETAQSLCKTIHEYTNARYFHWNPIDLSIVCFRWFERNILPDDTKSDPS